MKYQYRLINENEEEEVSGLKGLQVQNELILTALGGRTAKELIDIINDPKNLKSVYSKNDPELKELETRVFGPSGKVSNAEYIEIYNKTYSPDDPFSPTNGPTLYKTISQEIRGFQPGQKKEILDKGQRVAVFPTKTAENLAIVSEFFTKRMSKTNIKKADIKRPKEVDEFTLKFPISDGPTLKKILTNAGLESGDDYKLSKQEVVDENLYKLVREEILKYYKK